MNQDTWLDRKHAQVLRIAEAQHTGHWTVWAVLEAVWLALLAGACLLVLLPFAAWSWWRSPKHTRTVSGRFDGGAF